MNEERGRTTSTSRAPSRATSRAPSRASRAPSRATSISRIPTNNHGGAPGSTLSRTQSLIRKQTAPVSLRPSDILIARFIAWKGVLKQLVLYFHGIADIQHHTARELVKLGGVIQVPFRGGGGGGFGGGNCGGGGGGGSGGGGGDAGFIGGEGGLQEVFYKLREDGIRSVAEEYEGFGRTIEGSIVRHLEKLRGEVKMHIKNIQNDTGKLATTVSRERELSTSLISALATSISTYKNTPLALSSHPKQDPYISNLAVQRQLRTQVNAENLLQKSLIITQANSASFEEGIVQAIQGAWATYEEWRVRMTANVERHHAGVASAFAGLDPTVEWVSLSARTDHLLDPDTPLREPRFIRYPCKDDPCVVGVHEGVLLRKRRYVRRWREARYVLTPAGFLHEFRDDHNNVDADGVETPLSSLFHPECTLGPPNAHDRPGSQNGGSYKFYIEVSKDGTGTTKGGTSISSVRRSLSLRKSNTGSGGGGGGGDHAWSFKAKSRDEMMEWWNDIKMLCARYLVASEQVERSGPVEAAVRAVGYPEEEDEDEEEDERSLSPSASEEEEEDSEFEDTGGVTPYHTVAVGGAGGGDHHPVTSGSEDDVDHSDEELYANANEEQDEEALPSYSHLHGGRGEVGDKVMPGGVGEVGENGFPTDKKSTHSKKSRVSTKERIQTCIRVVVEEEV
ncbi:cytoplasm protein [Lentinula edodes]|uniref:Cytoplasm protein n=1 Tax=Lentinula edodes TaxID=5353 RepID=A0A1Q3EK04_LENED|nr:cytoplasm protein [Lentinula edodes]